MGIDAVRVASRIVVVTGIACLAVAGQACSAELPTLPGQPLACAGVGVDAYLHGSPTDPQVAWIDGAGGRQDVVFPAGYSARFVPGLQVLDASGHVVMAEGDWVSGVCLGPGDKVTIDGSEVMALDCGPVRVEACHNTAPGAAFDVPNRNGLDVEAFRFTTADGDYVVRLADGSTREGKATLAR